MLATEGCGIERRILVFIFLYILAFRDNAFTLYTKICKGFLEEVSLSRYESGRDEWCLEPISLISSAW